nr:GNAT family N-acetyltransferase [Candidatus Sigynarchaeota archaeon]
MAPGTLIKDVTIRPLNPKDYTDIATCCTELAGMIPDLEKDIASGRVFGVVASYASMCIGAVLAILDVDASMAGEPLPLPCVRVLFIEVNKHYRGKGIGKLLMEKFIQQQNSKKIASITASLFKTYKEGSKFFEQLGFQKEKMERNKIVLKMSLWSDFGVIDLPDEEIT